jgi:tryptophanyl-tRNA synthetase
MHAYIGELERTASFKDKVRKQPENVNAGLLTYPVLMAADILQHRANFVPVGKDQLQHLEMTRKYARRFNTLYGTEFFPEPEAYQYTGEPIKIPGLDGSGKMGKSEGNCIYLNDEDKVLTKKVMRAVTDQGPTEMNQTKPDVIENLFTLMRVVSAPDVVAHFDELYNKCEIRYGDMKKQLAADILKVTAPIRDRYNEIVRDEDYLRRVAAQGAERARQSSDATLQEVRKIMGIRRF